MKRNILSAVLLTALLCGHLAPARADFIFDNFGPGETFNTGTGPGNAWPINSRNGPAPNTRSDVAMAFTPTADKLATGIKFAASVYEGPPQLQAYLTTTVGAEPSLTPLGQIFTFNSVPSTPTILRADYTVAPLLLAGVQYWLVVRSDPATVPIPGGEWHVNSIGSTGTVALGNPAGGWQTVVTGAPLGAFAVIPEPGSLTLAGLSACGLVSLAWRRRKQAA